MPTYDLGHPPVLAVALERLTELVVKPRFGHGGRGVVVCAHAEPGDLDALQRRLQHEPEHYVAQDLVVLSRHPTVSAGTMQPGHVDLRALAAWRDADCSLLRGGLTRYARAHGAMVVNSWQGGGAKHAWVLA